MEREERHHETEIREKNGEVPENKRLPEIRCGPGRI